MYYILYTAVQLLLLRGQNYQKRCTLPNLKIQKRLLIFVFTDMNTAQIEAENTQMTNDLYRLLKKYTGLRNLIRELKVSLSHISNYLIIIGL